MQTKTCMGLATVVATAFAGAATAQSVDFALEFAAGGQMVEFYFEHSGSIDTAHVALDFTNSGDYTWAGDLTIGLISPDGTTVEFGGYDVFFGYPSAGDFPGDWDVSSSGSFTHDIDFASLALSGDGTWTLQLMNGYSGSASADWVGNFGGEGCDDCPTNDCNNNGVEDIEDIANGTSQDCDGNLIPDECQSDCDGDGTPDACDDPCPGVAFDIDDVGGVVVEYTFTNTGVMDEIEIEFEFTNQGDLTWAGDLLFAIVAPSGSGVQFGGYNLQFNDYIYLGDFPADYDVDVSGPYGPITFYFPDPDALEGEGEWTLLVANGYAQSTGARWAGMVSFEVCDDCIVDCNDNGVADSEDIANGTSEDCDLNGRPDECDIADGGDANGDGTLDACQEADCTFETNVMVDGVGTYEEVYTVDFSGSVEAFTCGGTFTNTSGDLTWAGDVLIGITDPNGNSVEFGGYDHTFGYVSIGDFPASWDVVDSGEYAAETMNAAGYGLMGDGTWTIQIANGYAASIGSAWDLTVSFCSLGDPGPTDCNNNGIDDAQDIADGTSMDCNENGRPDECDIADGNSDDADGNGVPDECEEGCDDSPDLNGDGCVNGADVGLILSVWGSSNPAYGDLNCDGTVNGADFGIVLAGWTGC
jgi:hypothetical protein